MKQFVSYDVFFVKFMFLLLLQILMTTVNIFRNTQVTMTTKHVIKRGKTLKQ